MQFNSSAGGIRDLAASRRSIDVKSLAILGNYFAGHIDQADIGIVVQMQGLPRVAFQYNVGIRLRLGHRHATAVVVQNIVLNQLEMEILGRLG